jgi:ABC-type Fe3+/spermidine/putrescine transport system ATPase subunit
LWNRPRTVFAAQFLGGANIVAGDARPEAGGSAVATSFGVLHTTHVATGPVQLFVRPEHVGLVAAGPGPNRIPCRVISQRFLGDVRQLELRVESDGTVLGCKTRTSALPPDAAVTAYVDPAAVEVLRDDSAPTPRD